MLFPLKTTNIVKMLKDRNYKIEIDDLKGSNTFYLKDFFFLKIDLESNYKKSQYLTIIDNIMTGKKENIIILIVPDNKKVEWENNCYNWSLKNQRNPNIFEIFEVSFFIIDPTIHYLTPKHIKLTKEEKIKVLKELGIKDEEKELPLILSSDPIIRWLGFKIGDVIKIIRDSGPYYRYVQYEDNRFNIQEQEEEEENEEYLNEINKLEKEINEEINEEGDLIEEIKDYEEY